MILLLDEPVPMQWTQFCGPTTVSLFSFLTIIFPLPHLFPNFPLTTALIGGRHFSRSHDISTPHTTIIKENILELFENHQRLAKKIVMN
jgi:hypothetical protein